MKWHRNPFFHTAVLPPSVAPSALTSARPSADIDSATAAATIAAAIRNDAGNSDRPSTDQAGPSTLLSPNRVSFQQHRSSLQQNNNEHRGILAEAASRVAHGGKLRRGRATVPKLTICEPSDHLTPYQAFYIFGIDGLGAFLLSGAINFAIAYAMYKTIDTERHPIRVFEFPNTLVGDAAVTTFIQCVMTWFIELVLVNRDLRTGHIQPIGFIKEPSNSLVRWFLLLDRRPPTSTASDDEGGSSGDDDLRRPLSAPHDENCRCAKHAEQYAPGSWKHWAVFLVSQLIRALMIGVIAFVLLIGPTIGLLIAAGDKRGGDWSFDGTSWAPPIFKLIYGGVLALLTTPPFAAFWLVRCGWAVQANQRHLEAAIATV